MLVQITDNFFQIFTLKKSSKKMLMIMQKKLKDQSNLYTTYSFSIFWTPWNNLKNPFALWKFYFLKLIPQKNHVKFFFSYFGWIFRNYNLIFLETLRNRWSIPPGQVLPPTTCMKKWNSPILKVHLMSFLKIIKTVKSLKL